MALVHEALAVAQQVADQVLVLEEFWLLVFRASMKHFQIGEKGLHKFALDVLELKLLVLAAGANLVFACLLYFGLAVGAKDFITVFAFLKFNRNLVAHHALEII